MPRLFDDAPLAGWLVIPRWEDFQHYKDRAPIWIKVYTRLMDDDRFLELSFAERGLLITLWLEYAKSRSELRMDAGKLSRRLGQRVLQSQLQSLLDAGLIAVSDSKPAQKFALEVEKEKEKEKAFTTSSKTTNGYRAHNPLVCPQCALVVPTEQRLKDHLEIVHGG